MSAETCCLLLTGGTGINRLSVQSAFTSLDCDIVEAATSDLALARLARRNISLVLMNDSADSIACCRQIMANHPRLPVVLPANHNARNGLTINKPL